MAQYCPHTKTCPFYQNWEKQTKDRRTDVIIFHEDRKIPYYDCLTLIAAEDPMTEGGIIIGDELKNRLSDPTSKSFGCSHITLLNLLNK